jgi:F0F1-type ATP synthase assembly protein I
MRRPHGWAAFLTILSSGESAKFSMPHVADSSGCAVAFLLSIGGRRKSLSANVLAVAARQSLRLLVWQAGCVVALSLVFAAFGGGKAGWSSLVGGGIGLIWTVYMTVMLAKHSIDYGVRLGMATLIVGWVAKVALTISLLIIAFRSQAIAPLPLLGGLGGALIAYWAWLTFRVKHADGANGE